MGRPVIEFDSSNEKVDNYVEDAKLFLGGRENSLSKKELENILKEDLDTWQDQEYHLVNQALDKLEEDDKIASYRSGTGNPLSAGTRQFYIE